MPGLARRQIRPSRRPYHRTPRLLARATDARSRTQPEQHDADYGPYLINHYLPMEAELQAGDAIMIGTMSASIKFSRASADGGRAATGSGFASHACGTTERVLDRLRIKVLVFDWQDQHPRFNNLADTLEMT